MSCRPVSCRLVSCHPMLSCRVEQCLVALCSAVLRLYLLYCVVLFRAVMRRVASRHALSSGIAWCGKVFCRTFVRSPLFRARYKDSKLKGANSHSQNFSNHRLSRLAVDLSGICGMLPAFSHSFSRRCSRPVNRFLQRCFRGRWLPRVHAFRRYFSHLATLECHP